MLLFVLVGPERDDSQLQRAASGGKQLVRACKRARTRVVFSLKMMHFAFLSIVWKPWKTVGTLRVNQESQDLTFICSTYIFSSVQHIFLFECITLNESRSLLLSPFLACGCIIACALLHYFANIKSSVSAAKIFCIIIKTYRGTTMLHNAIKYSEPTCANSG